MSAAEQLAQVQAEMDHHWFSIRLHQDCIRQLQAQQRVLREAIEREEARELRAARKWCGAETRRSA